MTKKTYQDLWTEIDIAKGRILDLERLVLSLSDLLNQAIATKGELSDREWEEEEKAQRSAYVLKHPEVLE